VARDQQLAVECAAYSPDFPFERSLSFMLKLGLEDIALALGLSTGVSLKSQKLCDIINDHFMANPSLKEHPRYIGLFT
jgi:hypothetical protein